MVLAIVSMPCLGIFLCSWLQMHGSLGRDVTVFGLAYSVACSSSSNSTLYKYIILEDCYTILISKSQFLLLLLTKVV